MNPQVPPQSRVEPCIGSQVILMGIAVMQVIWSGTFQAARYAQTICALPTGYGVYAVLVVFLVGYWLGERHHWAPTTPQSGSSFFPFLTTPIEIIEGSSRRNLSVVIFPLICACVYRPWSRQLRTMSAVLTSFTHMHISLAHTWHKINHVLSYVIPRAVHSTEMELRLGSLGA
jgi:hypothetical protein